MIASTRTAHAFEQLARFDQSVWLDYMRRDLITSGDLKNLVDEGLTGVTSNPAIFAKAISEGTDYAAQLSELRRAGKWSAKEFYEHLAIHDIQAAATVLRPVYNRTQGRDGFVSLEVSPTLANDTDGTIAEARRLWKAVDHPNVMIKVPGTTAGVPAIEQLISDGININITLLFAQEMYEAVAQAFLRGVAKSPNPSRVASVASFFVSRIDTAVDARIEDKLKTAAGPDRDRLESLRGRVAIANAKLAYQSYKRMFAAAGNNQRVLWASTSTKNPKYRDVMYIEELIGPETINTVPPATLEAFGDHGQARPSLEEGVDAARKVMSDLAAAGISIQEVTAGLLKDAIRLFAEPFAKLLDLLDASGAQ